MEKAFRAVWWKRLDEFGLALLFSFVVSTPLFLSREGMNAVTWMFYFMFLVIAITTWYMVFTFVCEVTLGPDWIICRSLSGTKRLDPHQVKNIQVAVTGASSAITINLLPRGSRTILLKSFQESKQLVEAVNIWKENHIAPTKVDLTGRKFAMRGIGWFLIGLSVFLIVMALVAGSGGDPGRMVNQIALILVALGLIVLAVLGMQSYAMVTESGIETRRFGKMRSIRWSDVQSVRLSCVRSKGSNIESMKIETHEKPLFFGQGYDDFPLLRDAILAKVDPINVKDERPTAS